MMRKFFSSSTINEFQLNPNGQRIKTLKVVLIFGNYEKIKIRFLNRLEYKVRSKSFGQSSKSAKFRVRKLKVEQQDLKKKNLVHENWARYRAIAV